MPRRGEAAAVRTVAVSRQAQLGRVQSVERRVAQEFARWVEDHHNVADLAMRYRQAVDDVRFWAEHVESDAGGGASLIETMQVVRLLERAIAVEVSGVQLAELR